ncbi:MAG: BamA/TamA family outer membrane protein [Myxococcaceae bacterium]|nr:BamA/TamA family outer membrane protein [Myxococcaceae bacterium]
MRCPWSSVVALLLFAMCGCGTVDAARKRPSPDALEVVSLDLEGARAVPAQDLKARIVTSASPWWPWWTPIVGRTEWFDANTWQADLRRLTRVYESRGYYQARVLEDAVVETKAQTVKLTVKVFEGKPAKLRRLTRTGLDGLEGLDREKLDRALTLSEGRTFLEDDWAADKVTLVSALHEAGYAMAEVVGEAVIDLDAPAVDATLQVTPGPRYRIGQVFAPIGAVVPSKLIIDVASVDLEPGRWYSDSMLADAQARIFQMGVFSAVKVNRGIPDPTTGTLPIIIDAREAPFHSQRWGGGAGGDLIRNEVRVFYEYVDRNLGFAKLLSKGALLDKLTLKARLGYAVLPNLPEFIRREASGEGGTNHGPVGSLNVQYEVPRVFNTRTVSLTTSLELSRVLDNAFNYFGGELKLGFVWRPTANWLVYPSVNANTYLLQSEVQQMATGGAPSAALGCPTFPALCVVGFTDLTVEYDRRDDRLAPRSGFFLSASAQAGLSQTTRFTPFIRLLPEARGYVSFGASRQFTLAGKLRAGTLVGFGGGETPIVARFFSGGAYMRGFNQRRLSPMAVVPLGTGPLPSNELGLDGQPLCQRNAAGDCLVGPLGATVPIGGDGLLEASLEFRVDVTDTLTLAVFVDSGLVTAEPLGPATNLATSLYTAVGFGVRYRTPLGPIRSDVAFRLPFIGGPLLPKDPGQPAYFTQSGCFFNLGASGSTTYAGAPDSVCTFHLSIGEAF